MQWSVIERARARLAGERGTTVQDWGGRFPVALIYPNRYFVGMSSLGFQLVYRLLNAQTGFLAERAFVENVGPILSVESQRPLNDFAMLAFSISFELDYFHLVTALRAAGLPLRAEGRDESHPLVAGGGPCLTANPEPVAPFFDFILIGEAEAALPAVCAALREHEQDDRQSTLQALSRLPGIYVPQLHRADDPPVQRQWVRDLDAWPATSTVHTADTELGDILLAETARGCGRGCRFCLAGFCYRPMRWRSVQALLQEIDAADRQSGRVGLVGAAVSDYPAIDALVAGLRRRNLRISVSSLRADSLSEGLLRGLAESGARTVTIAPEAGTERLRRAINKQLDEAALMRAIDQIAGWRFSQLKLYFMVGLPGETDEDREAIPRLTHQFRQHLEARRAPTRIAVNLGPFVPKAHTPFERAPLMPLSIVKAQLQQVRQALLAQRLETPAESAEWAEVQAVLARGDRRLAGVLEAMQGSSLAAWRRGMKERGLSPADPPWGAPGEGPLPWDVVDIGVRSRYLRNEERMAGQARTTVPCPPAGCMSCGVCPPPAPAGKQRGAA